MPHFAHFLCELWTALKMCQILLPLIKFSRAGFIISEGLSGPSLGAGTDHLCGFSFFMMQWKPKPWLLMKKKLICVFSTFFFLVKKKNTFIFLLPLLFTYSLLSNLRSRSLVLSVSSSVGLFPSSGLAFQCGVSGHEFCHQYVSAVPSFSFLSLSLPLHPDPVIACIICSKTSRSSWRSGARIPLAHG